MACCKKHKAYILKYKALILKYMPYIFREKSHLIFNDLQKSKISSYLRCQTAWKRNEHVSFFQ